MSKNSNRFIDAKLGSFIRYKYHSESRRSFVFRVSKLLFTFVGGVTLLDKVAPFYIRKSIADFAPDEYVSPGAWANCGLDGIECGPPDCDVPGGYYYNPSTAWLACCKDEACQKYFCCSYWDMCGNETQMLDIIGDGDCGGAGGGNSANEWCAAVLPNPSSPATYICTAITCSSEAHDDMTSCSNNCSGADCYDGE